MKCSECGSINIALDLTNGEYYCSSCGFVIEGQVLDFSQIYIPSADGNHSSGAVTSFVRHNKGLGTLIDAKLPVSKRLKALHLIGTPNTNSERNFSHALPILEGTWNVLRVPDSVKIHSAVLYYKCMASGITRGRRTEETVGSVVYIAITSANLNRRLSDIATMLEIPEKRLRRQVNQINKRLNKNVEKDVYYYVRLCLRSLNVSTKVQERIQKIINSVSNKKLEIGKHPRVIAGDIVYKACISGGVAISQERIARILNISERSIGRTEKEWRGMVLYRKMHHQPLRRR